MIRSTDTIKIYYVSIPAHKFLYIKNYGSQGYFDFWEKQKDVPGQDCETVCGLLDSIQGKLDGQDGAIGQFSGQVMAEIWENDGRKADAYGVRLPSDYAGPVPPQMHLLDVPAAEYVVFEHGPFNFEQQSAAVGVEQSEAMGSYSFADTGYTPDETQGRIAYFFHDPERFDKRIRPVKKA